MPSRRIRNMWKWQVIYGIIHSAIENKGAVDDVLLDAFHGLGFSQAALMDLFSRGEDDLMWNVAVKRPRDFSRLHSNNR